MAWMALRCACALALCLLSGAATAESDLELCNETKEWVGAAIYTQGPYHPIAGGIRRGTVTAWLGIMPGACETVVLERDATSSIAFAVFRETGRPTPIAVPTCTTEPDRCNIAPGPTRIWQCHDVRSETFLPFGDVVVGILELQIFQRRIFDSYGLAMPEVL